MLCKLKRGCIIVPTNKTIMMTIDQVLDFLVDVEMNPKVVLTKKTGNNSFDEMMLKLVTDFLTDEEFTNEEFIESLNIMRRNVFRTNWK